jgi:hypothetical protein
MPAPTDLPEWDTTAANTEEPPAAYKTSGWGLTRKLGVSRYMNWWMNLVYQWIQYLSGVVPDFVVPFFPFFTYQTLTAYMIYPAAGAFGTDDHLLVWSGLGAGDHRCYVPIPIPANALGKELSDLTLAKKDFIGNSESITYKIVKSYKNPGALGTGTNKDEVIATFTESATDAGWVDQSIPCNSGAIDNSFDLYLVVQLTTADAGGGFGYSGYQFSNCRASYSDV